jgi:hypothetical protein
MAKVKIRSPKYGIYADSTGKSVFSPLNKLFIDD